MTSRERVLKALNFLAADRLPKDLGAMRSTGVSAFAYPRLVEALGLPPRRPKVHDTWQMLALPDMDVLDALGCDVATIDGDVSNAFPEEDRWHDYDFNGRLPAKVLAPQNFRTAPDGTVWQGDGRMPPDAFTFNLEHAGQPLVEFDNLPLLDLKKFKADLAAQQMTDEQIRRAVSLASSVRASTDKAVFCADHFGAGIGIGGFGGMGIFPIICLMEPDYVEQLHGILIDHAIERGRRLLPEMRPYIDIVMTGCDDWGTQKSLIASPDTFRRLFVPYLRRFNDEVHRLAPGIKTFIHTCGAIYDILDMLVESGFDILNPFQWPAGGHTFEEWKNKVRRKTTIWGGGVNTQHTLSRGTVADVKREVREVCACFRQDGGFVFNNIHNFLAEVPAEKIIAMYRVAGTF
jgi:uroporphyrinogen decarboxylase